MRALAQFAILFAALVLCSTAACAYKSYSIDEYRAELEACAEAVEDAGWQRDNPNYMPAPCGLLEDRAQIRSGREFYYVDPRYLMKVKDALERRRCLEGDECPDPGHDFAARVRYFSDTFPQLGEPVDAEGFPEFKSTAETILERREFRVSEPWLYRLIPDFVKDWFNRLVEWLMGRSGGSGSPAAALKFFLYLLVVIAAVAIIGYILVAVFGERGRRGHKTVLLEDQPEETLPPDVIRANAEARAREGNFREAARLLFLALIRSVEDSGIVKFLDTKTNREFMAELGRSRTVSPELKSMNMMFEDVWYGMRPCSGDDYRRFESLFRTCRNQLK